jgi:hypothetical protein
MGEDKHRSLPLAGLLILVALVVAVWFYLASDWFSRPVEPIEIYDVSDDPEFVEDQVGEVGGEAGATHVPPAKELELPGPAPHGFCPADGRVRTGSMKKTLRLLLDAGYLPDWREDGYSDAFADAEKQVSEAVHRGELQRAKQKARRLADEFPDESSAAIMVAFAAHHAHDQVALRKALSRARQLDPQAHYLALVYGLAHANAPDLDEAIRALDVYLRYLDKRKSKGKCSRVDVATHQMRARLALRRELQKDFYRLKEQGVVLLANPELAGKQGRALLDLVVDGLQLAARITTTQRRPELTVVVYRDRSELLAVTCSANWAGGVYDGTLRLHSGKFRDHSSWSRIISHESLHAQLGSQLTRVPTWFNEGLAQLVAEQFGNRHIDTYEHMLNNRTYIPFMHMFGTFGDFDTWDHAKIAYHQSLAMVALMIDRSSETATGDAVAYLRDGGDPKTLMEHVTGIELDGQDLLKYLKKWQENGWKSP